MALPVNSAAIIAGGASRRMGQNKALMLRDGESFVAHVTQLLQPMFQNIVIVTADSSVVHAANLPAISDIYPGKGPLGGIHAALVHFQAPVFCVACDLPFLQSDAIQFLCGRLESYDAALPYIEGRLQPLHAVYAPSCLPVFESELIGKRVRGMEQVLAPLDVRRIEEAQWLPFDDPHKIFTNLNTPEEARAAGFSL
jgi:molybdopterin-guanine dinucleotide biosynthesis protein A